MEKLDTFPPQSLILSKPLHSIPATVTQRFPIRLDAQGHAKLAVKVPMEYYQPAIYFPGFMPVSVGNTFGSQGMQWPTRTPGPVPFDSRKMTATQTQPMPVSMPVNRYAIPFKSAPALNRHALPTASERHSPQRPRAPQACDNCRRRKSRVKHIPSHFGLSKYEHDYV